MTGPHPQVKMQCRKGIPSALRARCWPLLCGAQVCQNNNPGTYQVRKLAVAGFAFTSPLRAPRYPEPSHSPSLPTGAGSGPWRPALDGDHWQGLAPPVPSARDVCVTPGTRVWARNTH